MDCVVCFQEVELFHGRVCLACYPTWYASNRDHISRFGCVMDGCTSQSLNTVGMCLKHNLQYWELGGKNPGSVGPWFNSDGTRKICSGPGCKFVVSTKGVCRHHYANAHYMKGRGKAKIKRNRKKVNYDGSLVVCVYSGCESQRFGGEWCAGHYYQNLKGEELSEIGGTSRCGVPMCEAEIVVNRNKRGLCAKHRGLATRFSLSDELLVSMHKPENYTCGNAKCPAASELQVDHDHSCCPRTPGGSRSCGKCVRGWLCRNCNVALGLLYEDSARIHGLAAYASAL